MWPAPRLHAGLQMPQPLENGWAHPPGTPAHWEPTLLGVPERVKALLSRARCPGAVRAWANWVGLAFMRDQAGTGLKAPPGRGLGGWGGQGSTVKVQAVRAVASRTSASRGL